MNLGQLIGELRMRAEGTPSAPLVVASKDAAPSATKAARGRAVEVLELARTRPSVGCRDLVAALGISSGNASVLLSNMAKAGQLVRAARGEYRIP